MFAAHASGVPRSWVLRLALGVGALAGATVGLMVAGSSAWQPWVFAPSTMARLVAAVPREFVMSGDDARFANEFIDSLFPMSHAGVKFDLFVSNADVTNYYLEAISVPTLSPTPRMTSLPLTRRVSAPLSASPALDLSASNREAI